MIIISYGILNDNFLSIAMQIAEKTAKQNNFLREKNVQITERLYKAANLKEFKKIFEEYFGDKLKIVL